MQLNFILVRFRKLNHLAPACKTHHTLTSSKGSFRHLLTACTPLQQISKITLLGI